MTHKRAKRWGRRAKSDGSCVPKMKRIKWMQHTPFARVGYFVGLGYGVAIISAACLGYLYIYFGQLGVLSVFGIPFNVSTVVGVILTYVWIIFPAILMPQLYNFYQTYQIRKLKRAVVKSRCLVCPRCRYDLRSRSDDKEPCPECGQRISRRECIRLWARYCGR